MGMKTKKRCAAWLFICVLCIGVFSHLFFPSGIQARADAYGDPAYQYIRYLAEHYPARIASSSQKTAAGSWIADQLRSFGYPVEELGFDQNGYHFVNYTATKQGRTDQIVYVGAHYDSVNTTGTDDNASGVAAVLEIAKRMKNVETEFTIKFCFFDGEESALTKTMGYDWANNAASAAGVPLSALPQAVDMFPSPTRVTGSDQHYFNSNWGIPYVYFEASRWCEPDGSGGNSETNKTCWYQTNDSRLEIADPNGAVCSDTDLIRTGSRITLYSGQTPIAQYQAVIYGDMSCDGVIDIVDFAYIKSQMLGQLQMTGIQAEAADIDGTGTVDIVDFAYLKSYMLGALQIPQH